MGRHDPAVDRVVPPWARDETGLVPLEPTAWQQTIMKEHKTMAVRESRNELVRTLKEQRTCGIPTAGTWLGNMQQQPSLQRHDQMAQSGPPTEGGIKRSISSPSLRSPSLKSSLRSPSPRSAAVLESYSPVVESDADLPTRTRSMCTRSMRMRPQHLETTVSKSAVTTSPVGGTLRR